MNVSQLSCIRAHYQYIIIIFSEFETILTSVELEKVDKTTFRLTSTEKERIEKILRRAVDREAGKLDANDVSISEDNPDGRKCNALNEHH